MSLANTRWDIELRPSIVRNTTIRFFFRIDTHNMAPPHAITGRLTDGAGSPVNVLLRRGSCRPLADNPSNFELRFGVAFGGLVALLTGTVTGPDGSRIYNATYSGSLFEDPGDTGTGTGQQLPA